MRARDTIITVIDFECTGAVKGYPDEPWQIGLVTMAGGRVAPDSMYVSYLRVGERPFNPYAPGRHAEHRDDIAAAPTLRELWPELNARLSGVPLAAHNAATEKKILHHAAPLHRFGPWIDTLSLARRYLPDRDEYSLEAVVTQSDCGAAIRELAPGRAPHDALYDAAACACFLEKLLNQPGWENVSVEALVNPG